MTKKEEIIEMKADLFAKRCIIGFFGTCYNEEQITGLIMLQFNLFYDNAKKIVDNAIKEIK